MTQVRALGHVGLAVPRVCRESRYGRNICPFEGREGEGLEDGAV